MAYDEGLATRVRELIADRPGFVEKKMFGGLAFLLNGNMSVGVYGDGLIVRLGAAGAEDALSEPGTRPFDMTSRPMRSWVLVDPDGHAEREQLRKWVERGVAFASSLPAK